MDVNRSYDALLCSTKCFFLSLCFKWLVIARSFHFSMNSEKFLQFCIQLCDILFSLFPAVLTDNQSYMCGMRTVECRYEVVWKNIAVFLVLTIQFTYKFAYADFLLRWTAMFGNYIFTFPSLLLSTQKCRSARCPRHVRPDDINRFFFFINK